MSRGKLLVLVVDDPTSLVFIDIQDLVGGEVFDSSQALNLSFLRNKLTGILDESPTLSC
uniref:Uncharacterized protein n=1 Tax=Arundo donax TaxID=35708 RepID=A0A0A8Z2E3_ARUDO